MITYRYVGPPEIADRNRMMPVGVAIRSPEDVRGWVQTTKQELSEGLCVATFVIDLNGVMLVADRRSEHVACAGGQPVLSAGEITFAINEMVEVTEVSNQSTGYCPEPDSWPAVAAAITAAGLNAPDGFALACEFRRCLTCGRLTLVKDGVFQCGVCGTKLSTNYNCHWPFHRD